MARASLAGLRLVLLLGLSMTIAACGLTWQERQAAEKPGRVSSGSYVVKAGDTLYAIAFRQGIDHRRLAAWNGLSDATLIYPGQRLRLTAPSGQTARASVPKPQPTRTIAAVSDWRWPTSGRIVSSFDISAKASRTGVLISGQRGQPVNAASAGEVVYSGSGLKGYGKLIIIRHNEDFLSAYGHNSALLVAEGDRVKRGQKIATMGETSAQKPRLHFEIRQRGRPVNPIPMLPKR
ncbi:MAG: peptidoglycan DD-metalloendopeptidase family protein [Woeseiaceae bacterium]